LFNQIHLKIKDLSNTLESYSTLNFFNLNSLNSYFPNLIFSMNHFNYYLIFFSTIIIPNDSNFSHYNLIIFHFTLNFFRLSPDFLLSINRYLINLHLDISFFYLPINTPTNSLQFLFSHFFSFLLLCLSILN
jgi:hypothetical protein